MNELLTVLYSVAGVVAFSAYWPTIIDLWRGVPSANVSTWVLFTIADTVVLAYAYVVVNDLPFALVSLGHLLHCVAILGLRARLSARNKTS